MEFEARDASQTAQQANAEFYEELAHDAATPSSYGGRTTKSTIPTLGRCSATAKQGRARKECAYAATERLWRFEPDRWGDGQLAQEASKGASKGASSEVPMENKPEPALVLACLLYTVRVQVLTPSLDVIQPYSGGYPSDPAIESIQGHEEAREGS